MRSTLKRSTERDRFTLIELEPGVRLDYSLGSGAFLADSLELEYRPDPGALFYVRLSVSGAVIKPQEHWFRFQIGRGSPKRFAHNEWILFVDPEPMAGEWLKVRCELRRQFDESFGRDGLEFDHISGYRIRGTMSIAAITLYRSISS